MPALSMETLTLSVALIVTNLCWLSVFVYYIRANTQISKLIASRTLSEYAWLTKVESGQTKTPKPNEPGYEGIWENEDG